MYTVRGLFSCHFNTMAVVVKMEQGQAFQNPRAVTRGHGPSQEPPSRWRWLLLPR